jgi:hypothetical protein
MLHQHRSRCLEGLCRRRSIGFITGASIAAARAVQIASIFSANEHTSSGAGVSAAAGSSPQSASSPATAINVLLRGSNFSAELGSNLLDQIADQMSDGGGRGLVRVIRESVRT